jgi:hypothetical protein
MKRIAIRIGSEERTAGTATMEWIRSSLEAEAAEGQNRIQVIIDTVDGQRIAVGCGGGREVQWGRPELRRAVHECWNTHNLCEGNATAEKLVAFFKSLEQLEEWRTA